MLGLIAIVCPAVPAFTISVMLSVEYEAPLSVEVHVPVVPSNVPTEGFEETYVRPAGNKPETEIVVDVVTAGASCKE
jgi:hypothetical protein